jgi:hypothetical protein
LVVFAAGETRMINDLWYKNAIVYCLSVGCYMDANGDGIGDFTGLMRRLDYLHGLGITAIWLMPFQVSPHRDDGYDVSNYYGVDPRYGTIGDFVEFTHGAKQRGIRVLIDLVINHTSDQHPWFKEARSGSNSKYRDWYVWSVNWGATNSVGPMNRSMFGPNYARRIPRPAPTIDRIAADRRQCAQRVYAPLRATDCATSGNRSANRAANLEWSTTPPVSLPLAGSFTAITRSLLPCNPQFRQAAPP